MWLPAVGVAALVVDVPLRVVADRNTRLLHRMTDRPVVKQTAGCMAALN